MREIKFRVWHKPTNQFVRCHPVWNDKQYKDLGLLSLTSGGELIFETMYDGFQRLSYSNEVDDFIVQQYTGLKDKNGVEIYEGDYVHRADGYVGFVEYGRVLHSNTALAYLGFYLRKGKDSYTHIDGTLKVLGNIFEGVDK